MFEEAKPKRARRRIALGALLAALLGVASALGVLPPEVAQKLEPLAGVIPALFG